MAALLSGASLTPGLDGLALVELVSIDLLQIGAAGVEERVRVLPGLARSWPIPLAQIRFLVLQISAHLVADRGDLLGELAQLIFDAIEVSENPIVLLAKRFDRSRVACQHGVFGDPQRSPDLMGYGRKPAIYVGVYVLVASDLCLNDLAELAGVKGLECVELGGTLAEPLLEPSRTSLALFDRGSWQLVSDALFVRETDGPHLDVEL
jgi:hypothetical protein